MKIFNYILLLAAIMLVGCADNDLFDAEGVGEEITIETVVTDYDGGDASSMLTRASHDGYNSAFVSGDKIGFFAVSAQGAVTHRNVAATYDGTTWTLATSIKHAAGQQYFAYYPYNASLSDAVCNISDIVSLFTVSTDQSTEALFYANDLLGTELTSPNPGTKVSLNFLHQMARVDITLPKTTESDTKIIVDKMSAENTISSSSTYTPWMKEGTQKKTFSILVKPQESSKIAWQYDDEGILNKAASPTMNITAGTCYRYGVSSAKVDESLAVDLGLPSGTKWAPFYVGAEIEGGMTAEQVEAASKKLGSYLAWGETTTKSSFTAANYLDPTYSWAGANESIIGSEHDAAHINWGGDWVMPTKADCQELISNCNFTYIQDLSLADAPFGKSTFRLYKVANKSDATKFIYFVSSGYVNNTSYGQKQDAFAMIGEGGDKNNQCKFFRIRFDSSNKPYGAVSTTGGRTSGMMVRPVLKPNTSFNIVRKAIQDNPVDMGDAGMWAAVNVGAEDDIKSVYTSLTKDDLVNYGKSTFGWRLSWGDIEKPTGFGKTGDNSNFDWINITYSSTGQIINGHRILDDVSNIIGNVSYDAGTATLGAEWQMPSEAQWQALINNCTVTTETNNGRIFFKFKHKTNGNVLYFVANGYIDNQIYYSQTGIVSTNEGFYSIGEQYDESDNSKQKVVHLWADSSGTHAQVVKEIRDNDGVVTTLYPYLSKATGMMVRAVKNYSNKTW